MSNYPSGNPQRRYRPPVRQEPAVSEGMKIGFAILSFFIPLVGLIMGLIYMNDTEPSKKAAGKLWLIVAACSFGLGMLCSCAYFMLVAVAVGAGG